MEKKGKEKRQEGLSCVRFTRIKNLLGKALLSKTGRVIMCIDELSCALMCACGRVRHMVVPWAER
jgi:hypothetical protein